MGSPSSSREKILQSASDLFYHVGYQATSVDAILGKCGVSKSNFYYHFKTKEELALEVLDRRIAEFETLLQTLQKETMTPAERLDQFFVQIHDRQRDIQKMAGCPFGNFIASLPSRDDMTGVERFRLRLSQLFRHMETALRDCFAEGVDQGEFRSDLAPTEVATFLVGTIQGLLILTKTYRDTEPMVSGFAMVKRLLRG
jgi:TetR/AcrR family transcriptional repressor of nem operon